MEIIGTWKGRRRHHGLHQPVRHPPRWRVLQNALPDDARRRRRCGSRGRRRPRNPLEQPEGHVRVVRGHPERVAQRSPGGHGTVVVVVDGQRRRQLHLPDPSPVPAAGMVLPSPSPPPVRRADTEAHDEAGHHQK